MTPEQKEAIERAQAALSGMSRGGGTEKPTGFLDTTYNTLARGLSNLGNIPNVAKAETYSALADGEAQRDAEIASGEMPWWEKVLTAKFPWAAKDDPDDLYQKAADYATTAQEKSMAAQENYPMSEKGEAKASEILGAESFGEGFKAAISDPLATLSGVAQVAGEQLPTIAAATALRNPTLGIGTIAGSGYLQNRYGQLVPEANAEGYNLLDKSDALSAVKDRDFMERQQQRGEVKGAIIGAVDLVTAGLASKTPLNKIGLAKNTGVQVVGGGGGEALAEYVDTGTVNPGEIIIEGLAEGVSAPLDVAALQLNSSKNSESKLQIELNAEDLALAQEAKVEQQAQAQLDADALVVKNRSLREAAKVFTPKEQFVKARQAADSSQLQLDAANPETEIGKAVEDNLDVKGLYDPKEVAKETAAFLKSYQKDRAAEALDTYNAEYQAALEKYASAPQETQVEVEQDNAEPAVEPKYKPDTVIRSRKKAIEKAEELLGKDFADKPEFDAVASSINGDKFKVKTFEEALSGALNPQAVAEDANALTDEATQTNTETAVATTAEDIASQIVKPLPDEVKLSKNEQKVWDVISNSFKNNEEDSILNVNGSWNTVALAEKAGLNSRQAAQTATVRLKPKLAKAYGFTETEIKQKLADTKKKSTEPTPDVNDGTNVLDLKEIGAQGGMETKASVNQGAREGMSAEDAKFMEERSNEPDAFENKRQELAAKERGRAQKKMVQLYGTKALELWRDGVSTGGVQVNKLAKRDLMSWISSVEEFQEGELSQEELAQELRDIENKYDQDNDGPTLENANEATTEKTTESADVNSLSRTADSKGAESRTGVEQVGAENTGPVAKPDPLQGRDLEAEAKEFAVKKLGKNWDKENPGLVQILKDKEYSGFQANVERIAKPKSPTKVVRKQRKKTVKTKFSLDETEGQANGTTANELRDAIKWFIGKDANWRTSVLNSPDDLITLVLTKELNIDTLTLSGILDKSNAQGVVVTDNDGVTRAFMFAENIAPGNERAAIAHELGAHIGMDNVLTGEQLKTAVTKIRDWAKSDTTSLEKTIAERALERVGNASEQGAVADLNSETIAYFVEEAVKAGVTPNSDSKSELVNFIRQLWADFKRALRKLRPENETALSAYDFVHMARGSARLVLATDFHGASNAFRKVSPDYMGLGNNAVGVGFYVSEDQETGAQYMMTRMDERGASGGVLERVDNTVADNELVDWKMPLSEQPNVLDIAKELPVDIRINLQSELGDTALEDMTGRQMYIGLTSLQLRNGSLEGFISDAEYNRASGLSRDSSAAMGITSAYLNGLGIKGIKVEIKAKDANPGQVFNKILFNAKDAVVVGRNDALDVDLNTTTPGTIKFSVPESETQNQTSYVRKHYGDGAAEALTNFTNVTKKPIEATKNLDRLVRDNEAKMPSARKWYDFMLAAEATRNEVLAMVESVINQARHFNMERKALINDFIGSSTFYQKWGYDPQWTDRKTGNPVQVKIDPVMKQKYDRLSAEEQQLVRDVFAHGRTMQLMMQEIAENLGVSKFFKFDTKLVGPYAPLKRFGKYVGELKSQALLDAEKDLKDNPNASVRKRIEKLKTNPDDYVISFFESLGAAETFAEKNKDQYASTEASEKTVNFEDSRPGGAQAYEKILGAVNANLAGLDQSSKDAMAKMIRDMYFQTLDDSNARLSGTKRLNRAGYDKDMLRAFGEHGMGQSNLIAQMKHGANISAALVDARKEAGKNKRDLLPVYNTIALKFQRMMAPRTGMFATLEDNIMKANSFYMLTSSLGYFFQNMTQPYFAVSNISGDFGWAQAATWGKLFSGYSVAKKVINTSFLNQILNVGTLGLLGGNSTVVLDFNKIAPELVPVLKQLQARGLLDVGITEDLRHLNMSPNMAIRAYDEMTHRLYQSARYVEASNRIASAVAAFKMAQQNPQKMKSLKMTPSEYAIRIVQDTQGNFSKLDAPALFDVLPKAPLQFRKYQFQMVWLHTDAAKQAFKGADPAMQKAGFRKLSLMLGYTGVFGGLAAVPMANVATSVAQALISQITGDDDEENPPKDLERWIRENVKDERTATLLTRGVPAALGWDFSQKLDQADLFMPYNSKYVKMDPSRDGSLLFAAQLFLGPTGTMVGNIGNFADFVNRGNYYRAAEYALPKGLRSYLETLRFQNKGYETRGGIKITDPTSFDLVDFLTNAVGLPSTDINQIKWTRGQQVEITQWFSKRTSEITRGYLAAYDERDSKAKAKYVKEFRELQKAKDRVRPFFNNSRRVLTRSSIGDLIKAPRGRRSKQRSMDSVTGR
jgi:hypothetical protein